MTTGENAIDATVYGEYTNSFVLQKDEIVDIILNNDDAGKHPFHLHGHNFQVIVRSDDAMGHYNPVNESDFPLRPMRRDTLMVRPNSNFVVRFKADNPGERHLDKPLVRLLTRPFQVCGSFTAILTGTWTAGSPRQCK